MTSVNTKPFSLSKQLQDLSLGPNAAISGIQSKLNSRILSGVREE